MLPRYLIGVGGYLYYDCLDCDQLSENTSLHGIWLASRILVVDDNERITRLVSDYLTEAGFDVITAGDCDEGVAQLKKYNPSLIMMDIWMPGLDGYHLCRLSKSLSSAPVLMMTGVPNEAAVLREMDVGADDVIFKPFDMNDLLARIEKLLLAKPDGRLRQTWSSDDHTKVTAYAPQPPVQQNNNSEQYIVQVFWKLTEADKAQFLRLVQRFEP